MSVDKIFLNSEGRLLLGGFSGALLASSNVFTEKMKEKEREKYTKGSMNL